MVWQLGGLLSVYRGITLLDTGGSDLRMMLLQGNFSFLRNTYTDTNSIDGDELVNVDTGYTEGAGGTLLAGARTFIQSSLFFSFDIVVPVFTPLLLDAPFTANLVGAALIDSTNDVVLCTAPFNSPVPLDSITAKQVTTDILNETGLFGIYHGGIVSG